MKYCFILWTRPEIIKLYSCIKYAEDNKLDYFLIHTNQHYSSNMDKVFFDELKLKQAKYNLWINWWKHWEMTWSMIIDIEKILLSEKPSVVFVQWDTNTVLAWWLSASKLWIKVAHIESWLRSYDMSMPEEINRVCVDHFSDYLFSPSARQKKNLLKEGIDSAKIFVVWNTIVDIVYKINKALRGESRAVLDKYNVNKGDYILLTTHRPSNVDSKENLTNLLKWCIEIKNMSNKVIIFPIHPRTKNNIIKFGLEKLLDNFLVINPIWFIENIALESNSYFILTDSWWIQEEACILEKKTLILRDTTERPETLEVWWALLVWNSEFKIVNWFNKLKNNIINWYNPFWDWNSAEKIFNIINDKWDL